MIKDGDKGTILQRDKQTYAIAPHISCGIVTPDLLRKFADVAEKYQAQALKITGATRIAIVGVKEEDIDNIYNDLGLKPGAAVGLCVRSVRACPGTTFCRLGQQNSLQMGMKLDEFYHGMETPGKLKMAVSGCTLNCAEGWVRDVGLFGKPKGWTLVVGGNVGGSPRIAEVLLEDIDDQRALDAVAKIIEFYKTNGKKGMRLGKLIEKIGMEPLKQAVTG